MTPTSRVYTSGSRARTHHSSLITHHSSLAARRYLIVNADDYGLSPGLNAGVLAAHREGLVTSTSLMANQPWAAEAVAAAPDTLGLGLHLNLTAGEPCARAAQVPSLVGADGRFLRLDRLAEIGRAHV